MGSDKKRKRRDSAAESDPGGDVELSEKKAAKKAKKAAKAAAAAAAAATSSPPPAVSDVTLVEDVDPLVSPIAQPMASAALSKRAHKLVEAAAKDKALRRGIKEVVLALRKGEKGLVFIAGDVFPVEVAAHIPLLCEEADVPYVYVARKSGLGAAALTKRPTSVVLVSEKTAPKDLQADIKDCRKEMAKVQTVF